MKLILKTDKTKIENEKNDKSELSVEEDNGDNDIIDEECESKLSSKCLVEQLPNTVSVSFKGDYVIKLYIHVFIQMFIIKKAFFFIDSYLMYMYVCKHVCKICI
jgi:hypothetical protein